MMHDNYIPLTKKQIRELISNNCSAQDWANMKVSPDFDPSLVKNTRFSGTVTIGSNCRIANIGVHIANYNIEDNVCIENVGVIQTKPNASFGNGVTVNVINEAGGRNVTIFNELSAQFAYILALHRHTPAVTEKLNAIADDFANSVRSDVGTIQAGVKITSVKKIVDLNIGPAAIIDGASSLINGSILSIPDSPTLIGVDVIAKDFIIAEGATVSDAVNLEKVYVGQSSRLGRQFSAEHSLIFANCGLFGSEACSIFAGPFTETHHKSTLLIAGLFSFCNAGSGTNFSNHKYKLGPVHEGKLLRGSKTGSYSYMLWPSKVAPFTMVIGKHATHIDTSDFPFSRLISDTDGNTEIVPAIQLSSIGTIHDSQKWPNRDRRKDAKRDIINFDSFSPYTVANMITGHAVLTKLYEMTDHSIDSITFDNLLIRRISLLKALDLYRSAIDIYLFENIIEKVRQALQSDNSFDPATIFAVSDSAVFSNDWVDIAGQIMPAGRLSDIHNALESGSIASVGDFAKVVDDVANSYKDDLWLWIKNTYNSSYQKGLDSSTSQDIVDLADKLIELKTAVSECLINDAQREFSDLARHGYGLDAVGQDIENDFANVRGTINEDNCIKKINEELTELKADLENLKQTLLAL